MSNQPNDIGVKAKWDNKDFAKGNQEYISRLLQANKTTSKTTGILSQLGSAAGIEITGGMLLAVGAVAALVAAFVGLIAGGIKVAKTLADIAVESAPLLGIGLNFEKMAGQFNVSIDAMRSAAGGTISDFELMRQANVALTGAGQMLGQEFGAQLPTLLKGARIAAQATGQSVDFLFQSLVTGIKRGSPLLIDNTGLVISQTEAQDKLAESLGITSDQLTKEQKQIALLNATTDAINAQIETMGDIQLTAADQMARVTAEGKNIKDMLGIALQPALATVTGAWADMLAGMSENIRTGGVLQDLFVKLGAVASIMADGIAAGIQLVGNIISWLTEKFDTGLSDIVTNAFEWGFGIVEALAEGMVQAISSVLTWAMNALTSALTGWLAPGSPPKVAPNLDKWGIGAINEYLKSMTEGDFDILNSIQGPLKDAFSYLESTGGIGEGKAGKMFANVSKELIKGIAGGDLSKAFEMIRSKAGKFGDEIVELAQSQLALATATDDVTAAEKRLEAAQKGVDDATNEALSATAEYNKLLREGADPDILQSQLDRIDAAEAAEQAAINEVSASEKALENAKEREKQAKSEVDLNKQRLDELMQLQKELTKTAEDEEALTGTGAGVPEAGGGLGGLGAGLSAGMDGITTMLSEKVAEMKQNFLDTLGGIWETLKSKWDETTGPLFTDLQTAWDNLTAAFKQFYDEKIAPMWEDFTFWLDENVSPAVEALQEVMTALGDYIADNFQIAMDNIEIALSKVHNWLNDIWEKIKDELGPVMQGWYENTVVKLEAGLKGVEDFLSKIVNWLGKLKEKIDALPDLPAWTAESPAPLALGMSQVYDEMRKLTNQLPQMSAQVSGLNVATAGVAPVTTNSTINTANIMMNNNFAGDIGLAQIRAIIRDVIRMEMR